MGMLSYKFLGGNWLCLGNDNCMDDLPGGGWHFRAAHVFLVPGRGCWCRENPMKTGENWIFLIPETQQLTYIFVSQLTSQTGASS